MGDFAPKEIEMENNFEKENEQLDAQNETCEEIASESVESIAAETPEKALALFNEYSQAYAAEHDAIWIPYS